VTEQNELQRRARGKKLTDLMVAKLPRKRRRYILRDPELAGHYLRIPASGAITYVAVARFSAKKRKDPDQPTDPNRGRQIWATLGDTDDIATIEGARDAARAAIKRIEAGLPPFEEPEKNETFKSIAEQWLDQHVKRLRTAYEIERLLRRHMMPVWQDLPFDGIRRDAVMALLYAIEEEHGHWTADKVLVVVRSLMSWRELHKETYTSPLPKKDIRKTPAEQRRRDRKLSDDEIRQVWKHASGAFGGLVQALLVTAQRREKVASMKWSDLTGDVWTIPRAPREKGTPPALKLPPLAMKIIEAQPRRNDNPFVFGGRGNGKLVGFSKMHTALKKASGVDNFTLHDLRRTARSLMSRAGVQSFIAEKALGHAVGAVEATYDVHDYAPELAEALAKLAALIETILGDNIVSLRAS
jgi:integrase